MTAIQRRPAGNTTPLSLTAVILACLAIASLAELTVLRTLTRTAIHIPDVPQLQQPYELFTLAGRYFYYLSMTLLLIVLPICAVLAWRAGSGLGRSAALGIGTFMFAAGAATAGWLSQAAIDALTLASVLLVALAACERRPRKQFAVPLLFGLAFMANGLHTALQSAGQVSVVASSGQGLIGTAEFAIVAFAVATPLIARRRLTVASIVVGVVAAVCVYGAFSASGGSSARILLLWNGGIPGSMPPAIYAVAAAAIAIAAFHLMRARDITTIAGLCLLIAGGIGLHSTYQTGLVVAGLAALHLALQPRPTPSG